MRCVWVRAWEGSQRLPLWKDHMAQRAAARRLEAPGDLLLGQPRDAGGTARCPRAGRPDELSGARMSRGAVRGAGWKRSCGPDASPSRPRCSRPTAPTPRRSAVSPASCAGESTPPTAPTTPRPTRTSPRSRPARSWPRRESSRSSSSPAATGTGSRCRRTSSGAAALGARNVLLLTGDDVSAGDHPEAKPLFDIDSIHLLRIARVLRDEGTYLSGRALTSRPSFFIGAVENPFAPPHDFRPTRLAKKVEAGAEFVQTQLCFNLPRLRRVHEALPRARRFSSASSSSSRCTSPARRARCATCATSFPESTCPTTCSRAWRRLRREQQAEEGFRLALETVAALRETPGVSGVHLISIKGQDAILRLIETAGLLPRPETGS